jgi:hypothetical protein
VRLAGFEPAAPGLGIPCSILLSYRRNKRFTLLSGEPQQQHPLSTSDQMLL